MASQTGPLGHNDLMQGEQYDARKEDICEWHPVTERKIGYGNLVCSNVLTLWKKSILRENRIDTPNVVWSLILGRI